MKNVAVILAGGSGKRLGTLRPKQFLKIAGKTVIEHTLDVFQKHPRVDEIVIVVHPDYVELVEKIIAASAYSKVKKILQGGQERYDSSLAAIDAYADAPEEIRLIFHDAVRPLVSQRIVTDVIDALQNHPAVDVAVAATDTIIEVEDDHIATIPDRDRLRRGQTPQGFWLSTIQEAYRHARKDSSFKATDDCGTVIRYLPDVPVFVVQGEESNMKITYEEDLFLLEKLFQIHATEIFDDQNNLINRLEGKVVVVFGGGYGIGEKIVEMARTFGAEVYAFSRTLTATDISDIKSVQAALAQAAKHTGRIDAVINTAGILDKTPLLHMDYETVRQAIDVNYTGNIILAKEAFGYLQASKGSLVLFTSSSYTRGRAMYSTYSSLKAATVNLVQALADEWEAYDVRVNCINPERTLTPMRTRNFGQEDPKTLLRPETVARVTLQTAMSELTGQVVDVKLPRN